MLHSPMLTKLVYVYLEPRIRAGWWCSHVAQLSAVVVNVVAKRCAVGQKLISP